MTEKSRLCARVVTDPREIDQLRWFQLERYVNRGLLTRLPDRLPPDQYLASSTYFAVFNDCGQIQATARIVSGYDGLPMLKYHGLYSNARHRVEAAAGEISEISRLAVASGAPHHLSLSLLAREFFRFGLGPGRLRLLVASVGSPLARILNHVLGVPIEVIGPTIAKYGDFAEDTDPVLIDLASCLHTFRKRETRRHDFFLEDLTIDLREPATQLEGSQQLLSL